MIFQKKPEGSNFDMATVDTGDEHGHCMISGNLYVRGEVRFAGNLRLDGRVDGKVAVFDGKKGSLILSKGATINGPVQVTTMIADGAVNGDIIVQDRIECRANAVIRGNVQYQSINIAEGAQIEGRCLQQDADALKKSIESMGGAFLATRSKKG